MSFFDFLNLLGGLCLFLFGMNVMGEALESRAGSKLKTILGKMTSGRVAGFLTGCGVTSIIQSSSATTVMVVGFVNSGLMTLRQAINVIMGANVGTTVTSWILSLGGISGSSFFVKMLKPSSFTPILALVGIILYMFSKAAKKRDTGTIFLGFAVLMFGMETMTAAVSGLADVPAFRQAFLMFKNPVLGVLAGAVLTAIIQSSSASVGILQALAVTGQVSHGAAIPIIMGQNIGTCITAILSSAGANKNAKRAAFVHLSFNVIGTAVMLTVFSVVKFIFAPSILDEPTSRVGIAICHSAFNILCVLILMPMAGLLEKAANRVIKDSKMDEKVCELDERLLQTPAVALEQCKKVTYDMADTAVAAFELALSCIKEYSAEKAAEIRRAERTCDRYEDTISTYLIKLSAQKMDDSVSEQSAELLKTVGDFERISDHAVNVLESFEELKEKKLSFTKAAEKEYAVISAALCEILGKSLTAFKNSDRGIAITVEPLEQVIDGLKEQLRTRHIIRMQNELCSPEVGFVWSDLLTNLERASDHCSNIAGCVIDTADHNLNLHETLHAVRRDSENYKEHFGEFARKYALP